ncbi:MAG: ATP-binding protein [Polyangiaceae bacterium]
MLPRLAQVRVLVLDETTNREPQFALGHDPFDFLIAPLKDQERRDLLEVLEDRYGRSSTVVTSQVPTKSWHETLADPTVADAMCDCDNAHVLSLREPSGRKKKGLGAQRRRRKTTTDDPSIASLRSLPRPPERAPEYT